MIKLILDKYSMRVLAIDVGIANLPFCLIEQNKGEKECKILDWTLVNLLAEDETEKKCITCNKFRSVNKNKDGTYCKKHSPVDAIPIIKPKVEYDTNLYGLKLADILENKIELYKTCDHIVIESQPALKAPKMKSFASIIYAWFLFNIVRPNLKAGKTTQLGHINANTKLKVYNGPALSIPETKNKYDERKVTGIIHCREILKNNIEAIKRLDNEKKKIDDLCDSFLFAQYKMNIELGIPNANTKVKKPRASKKPKSNL